MNPSATTLVTPGSLRNQFIQQEFKLEKASCSYLTTLHSATLSLVSALMFFALSVHAFSQSTTHPYLSASAIAIQQSLQAPCEQVVENSSLESLLDSISLAYEISICCDRRIARDTLVTVERRDESLEDFLNRAIEKVDAVLIPLAGVLLVAPKSERDAIEAAYWRLTVSLAANTFRPMGTKPFGWPDGSVASTVIQEFASRSLPDANIKFETEHDIWRAFEFRKTTTAATISTCLLSGFNLCLVELDGKLTVTPVSKADLKVDWVYSTEEIEKKIGESARKAWRMRWTDAKVSKSTKPAGWRVTATVASHRDLIRPWIPQKRWDKRKASETEVDKKGYAGALEGELERVIRSLAAQTKLDFFPIPLPASLESKTVKLKLNKTSLDDILKEITAQCGVRFKRDGQKVEIIP